MPSPPPRQLDATVLLTGLLGIVGGSWVAASQFEAMARDLGLPDGAATIQFLTGIRAILAELPEKIYQSGDARRAALTAAQDALDAAIEREEESTEVSTDGAASQWQQL